jgi:hypothetical protein
MKPRLKPPGVKRSKLKYDILLSNYAFKFNLRCYTGLHSVTTSQNVLTFNAAAADVAHGRAEESLYLATSSNAL